MSCVIHPLPYRSVRIKRGSASVAPIPDVASNFQAEGHQTKKQRVSISTIAVAANTGDDGGGGDGQDGGTGKMHFLNGKHIIFQLHPCYRQRRNEDNQKVIKSTMRTVKSKSKNLPSSVKFWQLKSQSHVTTWRNYSLFLSTAFFSQKWSIAPSIALSSIGERKYTHYIIWQKLS